MAELAPHVDQEVGARQLAEVLKSQIEEDRTIWHGWYSRHGGSVEFLGDQTSLSTWGASSAIQSWHISY